MTQIKEAIKFKKITANELQTIENFTKNFDGYSDFATSNLLCWNKDNSNEYCISNDTLIVKTVDNYGEKSVVTALSKNNITDIIIELGKKGELFGYIPEISLRNVSAEIPIKINDDRNSYDYIYSTIDINEIQGSKYAKKRGKINQFINTYQNFSVKEIDIYEKETLKIIGEIIEKWHTQKVIKNELFEDTFLKNKFNTKGLFNEVNLGLFVEDQLIGFSSTHLQNKENALINLLKTDLDFSNSGTFMFYQTNKILKEKYNIKLLNFDCDLGLDGLRTSKETWHPNNFLKKFQVALK